MEIAHLDREVGARGRDGVVHIRLLARGNAPVDCGKEVCIEHLEEYESRARVQRLHTQRSMSQLSTRYK